MSDETQNPPPEEEEPDEPEEPDEEPEEPEPQGGSRRHREYEPQRDGRPLPVQLCFRWEDYEPGGCYGDPLPGRGEERSDGQTQGQEQEGA